MLFPKITEVARELRALNEFLYAEVDVRLRVYGIDTWQVHFGDSSYDQDHRGYWGAATLPGTKHFNSLEIARDLIEQVKDDYYTNR